MSVFKSIVLLRNSMSRDLVHHSLKHYIASHKGSHLIIADRESFDPVIAEKLQLIGDVEFKCIEVYSDRIEMESTLMEVTASERCDGQTTFIYFSEFDIMRMSHVAKAAGFDQVMSPEQALCFRDKLKMKESFTELNIPCAGYTPINQLSDFTRLHWENTEGMVLKPRRFGGSVGVERIRSLAEGQTYLLNNGYAKWPLDQSFDLLAESYVGEDMIHVDGYWDGQSVRSIYVSEYLNNCMDFNANSIWGSRRLTSDSLTEQSKHFIEKFCSANACGTPFVYHAEFFNKGGDLVFNEIARRMAGARVSEYIYKVDGENLFLSSMNILKQDSIQYDRESHAWFSLRPNSKMKRTDIQREMLPSAVAEIHKSESLSQSPRSAMHVGDEAYWGIIHYSDIEELGENLRKIERVYYGE
tara:strand:- start:232992 stop:234230 length:1239 start_codon:yes stop_codon:yes gene_type:complete